MGIDLGGPFVDALRSALQASKPLVETLGKMAKAFSEANPKTQEYIMKMIALAASVGPVLKVFGKMTSIFGKQFQQCLKPREISIASGRNLSIILLLGF